MAVIDGGLAYPYYQSYGEDFYNISTNLNSYGVDFWPTYTSDSGALPVNTVEAVGKNLPVETITYIILEPNAPVNSYFNDYYFRIHIIPNPYALGVVLTDQNLSVEVWNTFFVDNPISGITGINTNGITIFNALGTTTYRPLDHRFYDIFVPGTGTPIIDTIFNIGFSFGIGNIYITGQRAVLFPFPPDNGYTESVEWLTDVIPSIASEQNLILRDIPRVTLTYEYTFRTTPEFSYAKVLAKSYNDKNLATPIWSQITSIGNINVGSTIINIDTTRLEIAVNDIAVIYVNYQFYEIVDILSFTTTTITLKLPTSNAFTNCYFIPLKVGTMPSNLDFSRANSGKARAQVKFEMTNYYVSPSIAGMTIYNGLPVITTPSIVRDSLNEQFSTKIEFVDFDLGAIEPIRVENYIRHRQNLSLVATGQKEIFLLKRFLDYLQGKGNYFYLPTFSNDCLPVSNILGTSSNSITVISTKLALSPPKFIRIIGDTSINMQISGIIASGANEIISFTTPTPTAVNNITSIQILTKCRADSDNFELKYEVTKQKNIIMFTTISVIEVL